MYHQRRVRCSSCGRSSSISLVWAMHDVCPHCLRELRTGSRHAAGNGAELPSPERVVSAWISAFNDRDLEAMLERMSPRVDFHPLRFDGLGREYRGHDGIRIWFSRLLEMEHDHRIELAEVRPASEGQTVAFGEVVGVDGSSITPFWSLVRVDGDKIVAAYHYLTDPDIMEYIRG